MGLRKTTGLMVAAALLVCSEGTGALGGVWEFTDSLEWQAAVGPFTTIDFTGLPNGTFVTDQYAELGILFTDGNDFIHMSGSHVNDGWGLGGNEAIHLSFDTPQAWIAVDFPGGLKIELFKDGALIYTSGNFGLGGTGNFGGLLSSQPFDGVVLTDWIVGDVFIDDLHFGVPAPPTLALLALASLFSRCSRRRC